jgi:signal peptidase I
MRIPSESPPQISFSDGIKRLAGFLAGAAVTVLLGWGLAFLGYTFGERIGLPKLTAAIIAAVVGLIAMLFVERNHRLSRLMGLDHSPDAPTWMSAGLLWLLGPLWLGYQVNTHGHEPKLASKKEGEKKPQRDAFREAVETVVFVVMLVLMLKLFVVEAFVIPTGSMAETLFGYKKVITCEECEHRFAVNASREAEPQPGVTRALTTGYCCPNCRHQNMKAAEKVDWTSGDRVLVGKFMGPDDRGRVVVFKFPDAPQTGQVAQNYIKRLVAFGGETVAIYNGDLYVTRSLKYDGLDADGRPYPKPEREFDLWRAPFADQYGHSRWVGDDYRYPNATEAVQLFADSRISGFTTPGGFEMVRKPDDQLMEMRRIVYDNDHQAKGLIRLGAEPRWKADPNGWSVNDEKAPRSFTHTGGTLGWLRYRHLLPKDFEDPPRIADQSKSVNGWNDPTSALEPRLITNFLGYNAGYEAALLGNSLSQPVQAHSNGGDHWCGDLMLETTVTITDPLATFALELSKGTHRYRAEFESGMVRLKMFPGEEEVLRPDGSKTKQVRSVKIAEDGFTLTSQPSGITSAGTYAIRFANVDCRLRVWVDEKPIDFGGNADYTPPPPPHSYDPDDKNKEGWTRANDLNEPAGVAASGGVTVAKLKLFRDSYYTNIRGQVDTYFVQPGHYLCMGDNSAQSSDGRMWGLVPERLMLGRAVFVFWPYDRIGFIK